MHRKEVFLLILLSFASFCYADISGSIRIGETQKFITPNETIKVSFESLDPLKERAYISIDDNLHSFLPFQTRKIGNLEFAYTE